MTAARRHRAAADEEQTKPGTTADVHYDFSQFALDKTQSPIAENYRTSLIVDPPDGRLPPQTPEAQKRLQAAAAARRFMPSPPSRAFRRPAHRPPSTR